jgi:hypothetical protein
MFTHKGKKLEELDDFKDDISLSSDGEDEEQTQKQKGKLN